MNSHERWVMGKDEPVFWRRCALLHTRPLHSTFRPETTPPSSGSCSCEIHVKNRSKGKVDDNNDHSKNRKTESRVVIILTNNRNVLHNNNNNSRSININRNNSSLISISLDGQNSGKKARVIVTKVVVIMMVRIVKPLVVFVIITVC